jgi:acetoin utilization deacetylase AcuC-like enzyme
MIPIFTDPRMIDHKTPAGHPEKPERLARLLDHWRKSGRLTEANTRPVTEVSDQELKRVHAPSYLKSLEEKSLAATDEHLTMLDPDTHMGASSLKAAKLAAGAAVAAVRLVTEPDSKNKIAFCAVRPPGHHARPASAMGFCLYGTIAVAAAYARDVLKLDRILIVDFDVHHGNGTQEMFYEDSRVGFLSVHRFPFYPGSGRADETGSGPGLGFTWNVPLGAETRPADYHAAFESTLEKAADKMKPQLVLISAGFDAHHEDPVGGLGLVSEDFRRITRAILDVADTHAGGRVVSMLEGGYHIERLVESASVHLDSLNRS